MKLDSFFDRINKMDKIKKEKKNSLVNPVNHVNVFPLGLFAPYGMSVFPFRFLSVSFPFPFLSLSLSVFFREIPWLISIPSILSKKMVRVTEFVKWSTKRRADPAAPPILTSNPRSKEYNAGRRKREDAP